MKTKVMLFTLIAVMTMAFTPKETYTFKGYVLDQDSGEALIGVNVLAKGTQVGTVTNINGYFELKYHQKEVTLTVNYVGYTTQEIKAQAGKEIRIQMAPDAVSLDEIVVTSEEIKRTESKVSAVSKVSKKKDRKRREKEASANQPSGIIAYEMAAPSIAHQIAPSNYQSPPAEGTVHNTEDYGLIQENRFLEVSKKPLSTFSIDVDAASYSNMRRFINSGQRPPIDAVRIEEMVNYFTYDYNEPKGEDPFNVITEIADCPWDKQNKLLHIGLQGKRIPTEHLPASNLVFLIDVSGSMQSPNKLPLLQTSYKLLADQLREKDRVAIVVYAGAAGLVLPSTSGADKQTIKAAIDQLRAGGSTAGSAGIKLAYQTARENFVEGGNNRVILATDGDFNVGASSDAELVRLIEKERESGVFLTVMGFGTGNYKDNKMQELANKGNGNHAYIDNISEAKKVLVNEFGGTLFTIAKDVKLQLEFNPAKVAGYRLIGYENRLLNDEDFNDDKKDAGELGAGHTVTALYEIIPVGTESPYLAAIDDLKYQEKLKTKKAANQSDEWLTVKLRYKQPEGANSKKIEHIVDRTSEREVSSDDFRWSAAVASAGMLLRDSKYKGQSSFRQAIDMAKSAKGKDLNGYRQEFINMMEVMGAMISPEVAQKK